MARGIKRANNIKQFKKFVPIINKFIKVSPEPHKPPPFKMKVYNNPKHRNTGTPTGEKLFNVIAFFVVLLSMIIVSI